MSVTGYVHEVLVNRLGCLSLPRKSLVRFTDRPDMTLDVYCGRKTTTQQQQHAQHCADEAIFYSGFLLYRGTYDWSPVSNKTKKRTLCLIVHIFC